MISALLLSTCILISPPTTHSTSNAEQKVVVKDNSKLTHLRTLLHTNISVDFDETPIRDAFAYIKHILKVDIVVRYNDDRTKRGIDPDTPITLRSTDKPVLNIIESILEQCDELDPCTWQLRKGYIEIGTKERLSVPSAREMRMYPIRDLLFEIPHFNNAPKFDLQSAINQGGDGGGGRGGGGGGGAGGGGGSIFGEPGDEPERITEDEKVEQIIDIILEMIEPDAWIVNGGNAASLSYYNGVLIIRAPDYIHRQLGKYP